MGFFLLIDKNNEYCRISSPCCSGFRWNQEQATCIRCKMGYIGINCDVRCTFPFFGLDCQLICNCLEKNCNYANGCKQSTKENSPSIYMEFDFKEIITTQYTIGNHKKGFNVTVVKGGANDVQTDLKNMETAAYQGNSLMYPIVGLLVAAVMITVVYIYTWIREKRTIPTNSV